MAKTQFGVNHPLAVSIWSKELATEAIRRTFIGKFIGKDEDSLIQEKVDLKKGAGDNITCGLVQQLTGPGKQGDATLEGEEEAMQFLDDKITVNQLRHAVGVDGKMTEQRVPYDLRKKGKNLLADWYAVRKDVSLANQICGNTAQTDTRYTGNNAVSAPSTNRLIIAGGQSDDQSLTSSDTMTLELVDIARVRAENFSMEADTGPVMRPFMIDGEPHYVMFLHDFQVHSLRRSSEWREIQRAAMSGGDIKKNPIFTGALGVHNGVVLHKWSRITNGVNSSTGAAVANTKRAVLCGAQAATIAFGGDSGPSRYSWNEELFDYGNRFGCAAGSIFGIKKTKYIPADDSSTNAEDFASLVVSTYAAQPTAA